jgi:nitrogen fixation NifU-like protein
MVDATVLIEATNPVCGDLLKLWVLVREGRVADVKFKVEGCIPAVACASWLTETMMGRPLAELRNLTAEQIEEGLGGLPSASRHASALAVTGLKRALEELRD